MPGKHVWWALHTGQNGEWCKRIDSMVSRACVGFIAAAVSMPMGGCRAVRTDDVSLVSAVTVDVVIAVRLAVL